MASINEEHSSHWRSLNTLEEPSFEKEIKKFSNFIKAPENLKKARFYRINKK